MFATRLTPLLLIAVSTASLAACGPGVDVDPSASPRVDVGSPADVAALASISYSKGDDGVPALEFDFPLNVTSPTARMVSDGDGAALESGQTLLFDYVIFSGTDGSVVFSTYQTGSPESVLFAEDAMVPGLWGTLQGAHVGAQVIFAALDQSTVGADGGQATVVMAITVSGVSIVLDRAEGEAVAPASGLPVVTLADNGAPSIDFSGAAKPDGFIVQPLIAGAGADVVEGQNITVQYTGWLWDGAEFDSSWAGGEPISFALSQGSLIDGWVQGLAGQPVGSQVLLVIPPELGYGDTDQGTIPPGSTLVFVVDILAAN